MAHDMAAAGCTTNGALRNGIMDVSAVMRGMQSKIYLLRFSLLADEYMYIGFSLEEMRTATRFAFRRVAWPRCRTTSPAAVSERERE
jgi:hypothetical protein